MPASSPVASTTWVMPEMVSGPRCPVQMGPGWRPRTSSHTETSSRARLASGTERNLVALAVQPDLTGAGGDREVPGVEPGALLDPRAGVQQHRDDRGVAGTAPGGRAAERGLLLAGERVGLAGPGNADSLHDDAEAGLLVHQRDGG